MCVSVCIICVCVYMCVCVYIYICVCDQISSSVVTYSHCTLSHMCGNPHILGGVEDCS